MRGIFMKKSILLVMMILLSSHLHAEELHYHKGMWCLKSDGSPKGRVTQEEGYISIFNENDATGGTDRYTNQSLQEAFIEQAIKQGIPKTIPLKKVVYKSEKIGGEVTIEPISKNQVYIGTWQDGNETANLLTYYSDKKQTRKTFCYEVP